MDKNETLAALEMLRAAIENQAAPELDEGSVRAIAAAVMDEKMAAALPEMLQQFGALAAHSSATAVEGMRELVEALQREVAKLRAGAAPRKIEVVNGSAPVVELGAQHYNFELLLRLCASRDSSGRVPPVYLHGPAGTGKTTAAENVAKALGVEFYFNGAIDSEYKLSGFVDAGGVFRSRPFYEAYSKGGVYLFDELDSSLPGAVLAFNSALANGFADFPCGRVARHPDCIIIAAGNSCMRGDGAESGFDRIRQDSSFRDRFAFLEWGIDRGLEASMIGAPVPADWSAPVPALGAAVEWTADRARRWLEIVTACRVNAAAAHVLDYEITPRASKSGMSYICNGVPVAAVVDLVLRKGLPAAEWSQVARGVDFDFV